MKKISFISIIIVICSIFSYIFVDRDLAMVFRYAPTELKSVAEIFTEMGDSKYSLVVTFGLFIYFRFKKQSLYASQAIFVWLSVAISGILVNIIKIIFARPRPKMLFADNLYGFEYFKFGQSWSFPSGHSATAWSLAIALIFLFPTYKKELLILAVLIAFSRVVLCAHFLSDILIGGLLGALTVLVLEKYISGKKCFDIYQDNCERK